MVALYSFMPVVVKMSSATAVNLSLLTADLFSLFCGLFLFHYQVGVGEGGGLRRSSDLISCPCSRPQFSVLYILSFVVITVGFIMFNAVPTHSAPAGSAEGEPGTGSDGPTESCSDVLLPADGTAL